MRSVTLPLPLMVAKRSRIYSRSVCVGIRPITEIPESLRKISAENRGGARAADATTSMLSITRAVSTIVPAVLSAAKRVASVGAIPSRVTCKPSASTSAHGISAVSSAWRTPISEVSSISFTEKLAATSETTAAETKVIATMAIADRRMGVFISVVGPDVAYCTDTRRGFVIQSNEQCNRKKEQRNHAGVTVNTK